MTIIQAVQGALHHGTILTLKLLYSPGGKRSPASYNNIDTLMTIKSLYSDIKATQYSTRSPE